MPFLLWLIKHFRAYCVELLLNENRNKYLKGNFTELKNELFVKFLKNP